MRILRLATFGSLLAGVAAFLSPSSANAVDMNVAAYATPQLSSVNKDCYFVSGGGIFVRASGTCAAGTVVTIGMPLAVQSSGSKTATIKVNSDTGQTNGIQCKFVTLTEWGVVSAQSAFVASAFFGGNQTLTPTAQTVPAGGSAEIVCLAQANSGIYNRIFQFRLSPV